ncbi:MAG: N-acetyltransferase [Bacteroidales bacterium]|nr:N-acetyltransferase [Bacteroidales bacterium]MBO5978182.1 N-acetyltransferase [Bacteroidales bacterium]MBO7324291.1 N-acetyltransferase [Bacteroidales bacterium]
MSIVIKEVKSRCDLRKFVKFGIDLYEGNPYYCPPIFMDEMDTFNVKKNPALEVSDFIIFMAYRDNKIVGRIVGIVNHRANEAWKVKKCRFGWFDFIDDYEVFKALIDAVAAWGKSKGMDCLNGPVGFTDFDKEGLLIEGFDYNAPMASLYTHPYYIAHYERYGLEKEADWIEFQIQAPKDAPERMKRIAEIVSKRSKVHTVKVKNARELTRRYGYTYFDVFDAAYQKLYNFQPLTQRQKEYYCKMFFPLLNFDFVTIVVNEDDQIVAVGVGMPSLSDALRKCKGRLFPFGWYHILKALKAKKMTDFDLLLIAVRPDYQDKGVNSLVFAEMGPHFADYEIQRVETTSILETNSKNQANFADLDHIQHKRRRAYIKAI